MLHYRAWNTTHGCWRPLKSSFSSSISLFSPGSSTHRRSYSKNYLRLIFSRLCLCLCITMDVGSVSAVVQVTNERPSQRSHRKVNLLTPFPKHASFNIVLRFFRSQLSLLEQFTTGWYRVCRSWTNIRVLLVTPLQSIAIAVGADGSQDIGLPCDCRLLPNVKHFYWTAWNH